MFGQFKKPQSSGTPPEREAPWIDENLVDIGGELNVRNLLRAYSTGSFPWTVHPVTWWSPDPRAIIEFDQFAPSRSLKKLLRKGVFSVTIDRAFSEVIQNCASAPNRGGTWITPEFLQAYNDLHRCGYAHSLEVWQGDTLVGGIYGVGLGAYFAGESMFHRVSNASKVALASLVAHLKARGYDFLDVQMPTRITLQLGASFLPREIFLARLGAARKKNVSFGTRCEGDSKSES